MKKLWILGAILAVLVFAASPWVSLAGAQERSCKSKVVGMWRRGLRRAVDNVTQNYLDGKTDENGLQEPISDVVAYSVYLIPCVQSMGESWDPAMKLLIDSTQEEFASSDDLAKFIFISQMTKAGADIKNVRGFWEGRNFKVIP